VSPALAQVRASLLAEGTATEIALGPLPLDAAASVVERVHGSAVPPEAIEAIWRKAEGNPFFIRELASAIEADGTVVVPERLYDILQARLLGLDPGVRALIERAAVTGDEFTADEFAAVGGVDEAAAFDALDRLLGAGFIVERGGGYRFAHTLLREALAHALPAHRRAQVHRIAAGALSASGAPAGRVAHHLLEGGRAVEAVPWLERAARSAAAVAAYADSLALTAVETLVAALGSCIAGTYAAHATARGVEIDGIDVELEGKVDLNGLLQLAPVRPGPSGIRAKVRVKSGADDATLTELCEVTKHASPVYDALTNPVPVETWVERA
jgi:uncharacterized OsmC-like protein